MTRYYHPCTLIPYYGVDVVEVFYGLFEFIKEWHAWGKIDTWIQWIGHDSINRDGLHIKSE